MTRKSATFIATSFVMVASLALAAGALFAQGTTVKRDPAPQAADNHVQVEQEAAAVEGEAMVALGATAGTCQKVADPMFRMIEPADLDAASKDLTKPAWVSGRFVGSIQELAGSDGSKVAASGSTTAWTIATDKSGHRFASEYQRIDLPSGRVAWQPGQTVEMADCSEPVD